MPDEKTRVIVERELRYSIKKAFDDTSMRPMPSRFADLMQKLSQTKAALHTPHNEPEEYAAHQAGRM